MDNKVFNGWWIILWFILFAGCIFITAKILTSVLDSLCKKTKVSKIFMGGIVMSLVTSFPELISTIYGSFDNQPLFAIYNESGSNVIQIFILSITMIAFFIIEFSKNKKQKNKPQTISQIYKNSLLKITLENKVIIAMMCSFYALFCLFVLVPAIGKNLYIPGWNISIISIVPFVMWIGFFIWTTCKRNSQDDEISQQLYFDKYKEWVLWILFTIFSLLLIGFSYLNASSVDKMSEYFNIPTQSAASVLLSIPSALPETLTMIFLFRKKQYELGFSALVGSGLTNSSFMFIADSIYRQPIFKEFFESSLSNTDQNIRISAIRMQYWIPLILAIYLILLLTTWKKVAKSNKLATLNLSTISILYLVGTILISTLVF